MALAAPAAGAGRRNHHPFSGSLFGCQRRRQLVAAGHVREPFLLRRLRLWRVRALGADDRDRLALLATLIALSSIASNSHPRRCIGFGSAGTYRMGAY